MHGVYKDWKGNVVFVNIGVYLVQLFIRYIDARRDQFSN